MRYLVALDFSEITPRLLATTRRHARPGTDEIKLLHVAAPDPEFVGYDAGPQVVRDERAEQLREEHRQLEAYAAALQAEGYAAKGFLIQGPTAESLLAKAEAWEIDLIVIGSHGHGLLYEVILGSVCQAVLKASHLPLLIVPGKTEKP